KAIEQVVQEAAPLVRDPDELHDALMSLYIMPPHEEWRLWFEELQRDHRASDVAHALACSAGIRAGVNTTAARMPLLHAEACATSQLTSWVAAERADVVHAMYENAGDCTDMVRGWLEISGPITAADLAAKLGLFADDVDVALTRIEAQGLAMRGS